MISGRAASGLLAHSGIALALLLVSQVAAALNPESTVPAGQTPSNDIAEPSAQGDARLAAGLLVHLPLDGNVQDTSGNGRHATAHGGSFVPDRHGRAESALQLDGKGEFIRIPVDINPDTLPAVTLTLWARPDNPSPVQQVLSHDNGAYDRSLGIDNRGGGAGWSAFAGRGGVLGYHPVETGQWTFLAGVYDQEARRVRLVVNDKTYETNGTTGAGWDYVDVGANPSYGEFFAGAIDDVRVYNRALSDDEIQALRLAAVASPSEPPGPTPPATAGHPSLLALLHMQQGMIRVLQAQERPEQAVESYRQALEAFTQAIAVHAPYAEAYSNRAVVHMQLEEFDRALDDLNRALDLAPDDPLVHYNLAALYSRQDQPEQALQALERALALGLEQHDLLYQDADLDNVRRHPGFQALLQKHGVNRP